MSRELLDPVYEPRVGSPGADVQPLSVSKEEARPQQQDRSPSLDQDDPPELPHIKEEEEEVWSGREEGRLHPLQEEDEITKFTFSPVSGESEEDDGEKPQSSQLHHAEDVKEECDGPEPDGDSGGRVNPLSCLGCAGSHRRDSLLRPKTLHMEDVQPLSVSKEEAHPQQQDRSPSLDQDDPPELPHIKEEEEEVWSGREEGRLHQLQEEDEITKFTFSPVSGESEEDDGEKPQSSQLHHAEDVKEECDGPEPDGDYDPDSHLQPDADDETSSLSPEPETDDSRDWEAGRSQPGSEPRTNDEETRRVAGKTATLFSCSNCGKKYSRKKSFATHMRLHTEGKRFSCSVCEKSFQFNVELVRHTRIHTGEKPFGCSVCAKGFARKTEMEQHMRIHTGEKPFPCPHCSKVFAQRSNLTAHVRVHTGEKPFRCSVCDLRFSLRHNLSKHIRTHTGEKPFHCTVCARGFRDSGTLKRHSNVHSGDKPFCCSVCGKVFGARRTLKRHSSVHAGVKPFSCSVCGNRFGERRTLKRHQAVHTGEKPFSCSDCGKVFGERRTLKRHLTVHTGEKPFGCRVCAKGFTRLANLKKHKCVGESAASK